MALNHLHRVPGKIVVDDVSALLQVDPFIDNQGANTFHKVITDHLAELRTSGEQPEELCIATGYFNARGWLMVADEVEHIGKVKILLGAEPSASTEKGWRAPGEEKEPARTLNRVKSTLAQQKGNWRSERDRGFSFKPQDMRKLKKLQKYFRSDQVEVRCIEDRFFHAKAWILRGKNREAIAGSSNLTAAGLRSNLELNLGQEDEEVLKKVDGWFDDLWEKGTPFDLADLYDALFQEFTPYQIYLRVLFELYGDEIDQEEQDEGGHLSLTNFQRHGVWRARKILQKYGGVIVADSVGLGKTFVAGGLMEDYLEKRQRILLVRPAALSGTWGNYLSQYFMGDVEQTSYEMLARDVQLGGPGSQDPLKRPVDEYQLIVIDEAHNYRNPDAPTRAGVLRQLMRGERRRDLVMLTATPVNNSLYDLFYLIQFFLRSDSALLDLQIPSIKDRFDKAVQMDPGDLNPDLLFPIIDATTVKRTRGFIKKHYKNDQIPGPGGQMVPIVFPKPNPMTVRYDFDAVLPGFFSEFKDSLMPDIGFPALSLARYQPDRYRRGGGNLTAPEAAMVGLLRSGLLKRFESSSHAFACTCTKMIKQHQAFLRSLEDGWVPDTKFLKECPSPDDVDDDAWDELLTESDEKISANEFDVVALKQAIEQDLKILEGFLGRAKGVNNESDPKLDSLVEELAKIAEEAKDSSVGEDEARNNRKVLIFTFFKDSASWIATRLRKAIKNDPRLADYDGRIALTSGSPDESDVLESDKASWGFAPDTAAPDSYTGGDLYDILIATDVLAEGVNLQPRLALAPDPGTFALAQVVRLAHNDVFRPV